MFNLQPLRHISTLPDNDQIADVVGLLFWSSCPEESHPRALPDPCVNLSIHTAPDARPFPWHSCQ